MWQISPLLPSLRFGTASGALLGKVLPGKDSSILCCFVINSGLKIQAQLVHHCDLLTFSKYECFELLWFQEQVEQWLIKSSVFKIRNKVRGMLQKARKMAGWKSLQVLGSISSSQCPGKTFNFLIAFFFFLISQYHQTHCAGRRHSGLPDFYMLSKLCNIRSNIITQGFVPCGLKMQHTSGSAGGKSGTACFHHYQWWEQGMAGASRAAGSWPTCPDKHEYAGENWEFFGFEDASEKWKHWSKPT